MENSKMIGLLQTYLDNTDKPDVINKYIDENIHAEKYITEEIVKQCINGQKSHKQINLDAITEEDKLIACVVIGKFLDLTLFESWLNKIQRYNLNIFNLYLVPRYQSLIEPYCEDMVDFEKELEDFKPIIKMNYDKWTVKLHYGDFNSVFAVDNLDKDNLKDIKNKAIICEEFAKKLNEYLTEKDEFLSKTYRLIDNGKDEYSRRENSIYLDTSRGDRYKKHFMIDVPIFTSCSTIHDFSVSGIKVKVKLISGSNSVAVIIDREIHFEDFEAIESSPQFFDLDEVYAAIKWTVDNNCQNVTLLD